MGMDREQRIIRVQACGPLEFCWVASSPRHNSAFSFTTGYRVLG